MNKIRVEPTGHYLLSEGGSWHGGIHITEKSHPNHAFEPVRALADGELVAYRITEDYLQSTFQDKTLHYSNSFCLLRHQCPMPDSENSFTFYSLYMHLRPLSYQPGPLYRVKKNRNTRSVANPADHSGNPDALPAGSLIECLTEPAEQHPLGESEYLFIKARTYNPDNGDVSDPFWIALHEKNKPAFYTEGFEAQSSIPRWYPQPRITPPKGDDLERFQLTGGRNIRWTAPPYASRTADATLPAGTELLLLNDSEVTAQLGDDKTQYTFKRYRILTGEHKNKEGWMAFDERYFQQITSSTIPLPAAEEQPEIRTDQLVILDNPISIRAGDALGYLGLHERLCRKGDGSTEHCHQIHLETFAAEPPPQALFNTEHWRWMKDGEITDHQGNPEEDNTFFKDLLTSLDDNDDQHLSYEEVQKAYQKEGTAKPLEHMISLHTNEWHDDANRSRYKKWEIYLGQVRAWIKGQDERKAFYDRLQDNLGHEKERLTQLKWLDAAQGRLGLTKDVWHLHPLTMMAQLQSLAEDEDSTNWLIVPEGQFTFNVEGDDNPRSDYFSRVAHATIGASGITIGRGYDLYQQYLRHSRNSDKVVEDLTAAGISQELIELLRSAVTLQGDPARAFYRHNRELLQEHVITRKQQYDLYNRIYSAYKVIAKRRFNLVLPTDSYDALSEITQTVLIDMNYRGDFRRLNINEDREYFWDRELAENFGAAVRSNNPERLAGHFREFKDLWKKSEFWQVPRERAAERIWFLEQGLPIPGNVSSRVFPDGY
ncbi:MAG: hypothetical protein JXQ97_17350 [Natronospirillum sp.]